MADLEHMKQTFFDECDEALQQIEAGLTDIRDGAACDDTINAVFRAVHSVKGGAGIFGFESLVAFAHVFETALDYLRRGTLEPIAPTLDVLLPAGDVLSDLVQMSRAGDSIPIGFGAACGDALARLVVSVDGGSEDAGDVAPADFEGLNFVPVRFDEMEELKRRYTIRFRPHAALLQHGVEPRDLFQALHALGDCVVSADVTALPSLADLVPDDCHVAWTMRLTTAASRASVAEVFAAAGTDCDLMIACDDEAAPPVADTPAPETPPPAAPATPVAASEAPVAKPAPGKPAATTTRIELVKIDRAVNMVGELVIAQAMLGQIVQDLPEGITARLSQTLDEVIHHTRELKDSVMSMRTQPVGAVFERMPRLVRELSARTGKKVRLEMSGETTEVDRSIIERLSDPLTHIIRNAVDHGIEAPAQRLAAGKSEDGIVRLSAEHRGGRIVIEVRDDGAGINSARVLEKARQKGLVAPDAVLSEDAINNLIMLPGFSTAETVSDISGGGVGMDVVRSNIQDIGGRISLKSERGRGMTIELALPLTLAVMDGMVIKVGAETYVVPLSTIIECLRPARADIDRLIGTCGMLQLRGERVPLVNLGALLSIAGHPAQSDDGVVIITNAGDGTRFGLVVDELCGHQQVVIKSIEESYGSVPGIAAATILGNGRVAFVLDVEKLFALAGSAPASPSIMTPIAA